ncbi:methyl-CpG-binding domain protein 3b isoform X3 [Brachyhypopomus gauderio]|uniref:methyl-CpG-binding domain protein 3b isoform X3 n=1 Tax=Brachyhypopomus gauderio TaxID=698409 RepID=UPI004041341B
MRRASELQLCCINAPFLIKNRRKEIITSPHQWIASRKSWRGKEVRKRRKSRGAREGRRVVCLVCDPVKKNKEGGQVVPTGKKFRSKPQLARYLGNSMDLSSFDFRTGKMLMSKLNKNRQRLRYDNNSQTKGKPDLNTSLPVRQTASIFKQPVTKVTNHPSNKVKTDPQKAVDQPRQLFWEKKLSGLNAYDIAEELVKTMDLPKGLQAGVGPGCTDKTLLSAIASALHTSSAPITGQLSAAVEKNPGVWLNTAQPLCKAFIVTDEDIRKQEELVYNVRKRLEEALMADMLAHVEEEAGGGEGLKDEGNCHDDKDDV